MLTLDLRRIFADKGIEKPVRFLKQAGFNQFIASKLLNNRYNNINFKYIEMLCIALNCTPDDLFTWTPGKDSTVPDNHPIQKLRAHNNASISEKLKQLPFEKIEQVRTFLDQLNKE